MPATNPAGASLPPSRIKGADPWNFSFSPFWSSSWPGRWARAFRWPSRCRAPRSSPSFWRPAAGTFLAGNVDAYFHSGGPSQWLTAGVTNLRGVYWEVERDTLIAIPLFIFMGIMLQRSKIAEDLLVTMAQLFGPVPGGLGISVVFVGALLAATTGIVGATVVAMGLITLPAMLRNNYSQPLATGTIAASGTLGQIIPPSIVLIILADQLASAADQASTAAQGAAQGSHRRAEHAVGVRRRLDQRRRDVPGRVGAGSGAGRPLHALHPDLRDPATQIRARRALRGQLGRGVLGQCRADTGAAAGADLPGAGLDHLRHRDGEPGRRHRGGRRDDHGGLPSGR